MREVVESGTKGISNGRGFYQYTREEAQRWERMLIKNVWRDREMTREMEQASENHH